MHSYEYKTSQIYTVPVKSIEEDERILTPSQVAHTLAASATTLARWKTKYVELTLIRVGKLVRYR